MKYHLYKDGEAAPRIAVAGFELSSNPGAIEWAKGWLQEHADDDLYAIESADGRFAASLIRSAGGDWYTMLQKGFLVAD